MFIPAVKILNWLYVMNLSVNNLFVIENIVFICVVVYFVISNVTHSRVVKKRNSKLRYAAVDQVPTVAYCSYSRREINETTFKY